MDTTAALVRGDQCRYNHQFATIASPTAITPGMASTHECASTRCQTCEAIERRAAVLRAGEARGKKTKASASVRTRERLHEADGLGVALAMITAPARVRPISSR